jgi:hypothetical protein
VFHVHNAGEFFHAYDQSLDLAMTLQAAVHFTEYFRCYVVGQEDVHIMPYDPRRPHAERYVMDAPECPEGLLKRVEKDALTLCRGLMMGVDHHRDRTWVGGSAGLVLGQWEKMDEPSGKGVQ